MTTLHTLDDYDWVREDTTGDLILQDSNNAEVMRWDVSEGDWTFPAVSTVALNSADLANASDDDVLVSQGGSTLATEQRFRGGGAKLGMTASQTIPGDNTQYQINFDDAKHDTFGNFLDAVNNQITVQLPGEYRIVARIRFLSPPDQTAMAVGINVNSSVQALYNTGGSGGNASSLSVELLQNYTQTEIDSGITIDAFAQQNSGAGVDIGGSFKTCNLWVQRVGDVQTDSNGDPIN